VNGAWRNAATEVATDQGSRLAMIARWELCPSSESLVDRSGVQVGAQLMRKLLKKQGITPTTIVTDKLGSYGAALHEFEVPRRHDTGAGGTTGRT
jgi:hypothetical protein